MDFFDRAGGVDDLDALRFGGGGFVISFGDALKERAVGLFNAVADERHRGLPRAQPLLADRQGDFEEQGEVGSGVTHGEVNDMANGRQVQLPAVTLIRRG